MTYYELLGVAPGASTDEIRRAYVDLARRHHPDVGGDAHTRRMQELNEAWHVLGDRGRRQVYDATLTAARRVQEAPPFRPYDDSEDRDWAAEAESDIPLGPVATSRWRAMTPMLVFGMSVVTFCVGVVMAAAPLLALAIVLLFAAGAAFVVIPFLELASARRRDGDRR